MVESSMGGGDCRRNKSGMVTKAHGTEMMHTFGLCHYNRDFFVIEKRSRQPNAFSVEHVSVAAEVYVKIILHRRILSVSSTGKPSTDTMEIS
jgi:hypothetical protein